MLSASYEPSVRAQCAALGLTPYMKDISGLQDESAGKKTEIGLRQLRELGLTGQVRAISFDTNMRCIELMQTGAVGALIVQNPYAMGYLGVEKAWQALQGMKFDKHELIDTMTQIVTKENMFTLESQKALFSFN